ncbi:MAG: AAA family ATPase [Mucilaginibacter sp.]|uniref:AAA family ATPase n=1 Tax=Mucilaginibacter sp. TaxID=1882438 RepID=UPI0032667219
MITKIDIIKFGLFNNYSWDKIVGKDETFRRLNIIYGRNYSGKTTLARVFKCMEDSLMHRNYLECGFSITLHNGKVITPANLADFSKDFKLRVYNTDFVRENLSWLHDDEGKIKPFTILGSENIELDKQITAIDTQLGSIAAGSGLVFELDQATQEVGKSRKAVSERTEVLEDKLRKRANDKIKMDTNLFLPTPSKKTYSISDIKSDIATLGKDLGKHILTDDEKGNRKHLLKEVALEDVEPLKESQPKFSEHYLICNELVGRKIKPSQPITELINDSLLQEWVRQGVDKHKDKRTECGFCGNPLPGELWTKLDAHFSKESEGLRAEIKTKIDYLQEAKNALTGFVKLKKEAFYASLHPRFTATLNNWQSASKAYGESIDTIVFELKEREKDIFKERQLPEITDVSENILEVIKEFNLLLGDHNRKTNSLAKDQEKARKELRNADIAQFMDTVAYFTETAAISAADQACSEAKKELKPRTEQIAELSERKRQLEAEAKDESKGAELVNQHLSHFFGHNELKLVAEGESPNMLFKIQRDGINAANLSEGECSLISFCYFIAKMQDELKDEVNSDKLVIYIDDPISSLDSNHIFFMFSLIESVIAGPRKYGQLFISTHNLDFLKYLKTLTHAKHKPNGKQVPDLKYFIIERKGKSASELKPAPVYLKEYVTEFNYLFAQILKCAEGKEEEIVNNHQYSFGNNMRKFLEAYLFFKYPSHKLSADERINKYFETDPVTKILVKRLTHEFSHIGGQFERGMEPIDVEEISKVANAVLNKIKADDPGQYASLVESVSDAQPANV